MSNYANLQIKVESTGASTAKAELDSLTESGARAERATDGLKTAAKNLSVEQDKASAASSKFRTVAGGLGMQLQDTAVQLQSGASGFVVLGQQGSQMASMFGPGGAVFGAVLAIGAALVGAAVNSRTTAKELQAVEEQAYQLKDAFDISTSGTLAYNERLQRLADTAPEVAHALFQIKKRQLELEQTLAASSVRDSLTDFSDLAEDLAARTTMSFEQSRQSAHFLSSTLNNMKEEFGGTNQELIKVAQSLEDFNESASKQNAIDLVNQLKELKGGSAEATKEISNVIAMLGQYIETSEILAKSDEPFEEQNKSVTSLIKSLELEAATLGMTNRERDLYIAKLNESTEAQYSAINAAYDKIEAEQSTRTLERLERQLLTEEEAIENSYKRRYEIIIANTAEGSERRAELLRSNFEKYLEEEEAYRSRQNAAEIKAGRDRAKIEQQVSRNIIAQKRAVADSGLSLLKGLTAGNEKAAKAIVVVEAGLNIARTIQNTAAAQVRALAELGPIAGPPASAKIAAFGAVQTGIIAANAALNFSNTGGSSGSLGGGISGGYASPNEIDATQSTQPAYSQPQDRPINLIVHKDAFGNLSVEEQLDEFKEHIENSDYVLIPSTSRNGRELYRSAA